VEQLNISNEKPGLAKLKEFEKLRKQHWKKMKDDMKLQDDHLIREEAEHDVRRARAIFDDSPEYQRALIYFLEYNCNVRSFKFVYAMTHRDVITKLKFYSAEDILKAEEQRDRILSEWNRPRLMNKFEGWDSTEVNGIICGKSGHGKSSLMNCIGSHLGKRFNSSVDIVNCTQYPLRFVIHRGLNAYDVPGHSSHTEEQGHKGQCYIRKYCLTYFQFVLIVMADRCTMFASSLYKQLKAMNKKAFIVRVSTSYKGKNMEV